MPKDINRYSFSRFKTYHVCPKKHHYQYVEQIETPDSEVTIPGKLFHEAIELYLTGQDYEKPLKEFETLCRSGKLDLEPDLLSYVFQQYISYYAKEIHEEVSLAIEKEVEESLDGEDKIVLIIDQIFEHNGLIVLRDRKTTQNKLKYTHDDVRANQQLLLYVPYAQDLLSIRIDAVEIDEIRISKLDPVPVNNNGKPTIDKKKLDLVTYESYFNFLQSIGIEDMPEYQQVLDYLRQRGHPLFNRVRVQILDDHLVNSNADDLYNTYKAIKNNTGSYRVKGPLCNYCAFKSLCELDMHNPSDNDRKILIETINATSK